MSRRPVLWRFGCVHAQADTRLGASFNETLSLWSERHAHTLLYVKMSSLNGLYYKHTLISECDLCHPTYMSPANQLICRRTGDPRPDVSLGNMYVFKTSCTSKVRLSVHECHCARARVLGCFRKHHASSQTPSRTEKFPRFMRSTALER
jgi:hypothetical protein